MQDPDHECPVCGRMMYSNEIERHHVLPKKYGGVDADYNLLPICKTCHALTRMGIPSDQRIVNSICCMIMVLRHGSKFLEQTPQLIQVMKDLGVIPLSLSPDAKYYLDILIELAPIQPSPFALADWPEPTE